MSLSYEVTIHLEDPSLAGLWSDFVQHFPTGLLVTRAIWTERVSS